MIEQASKQILAPRERFAAIRCSDRAREVAGLYEYRLTVPGRWARLARICTDWFKK
jgi:hypothetical protein